MYVSFFSTSVIELIRHNIIILYSHVNSSTELTLESVIDIFLYWINKTNYYALF